MLLPGCVASMTKVPGAVMVRVAVEVAPVTVLAAKLPAPVLDGSRVKTMGRFEPPPVPRTEIVIPPLMK